MGIKSCLECGAELTPVILHGTGAKACPRGHGSLLSVASYRRWLPEEYQTIFDERVYDSTQSRKKCPSCKEPVRKVSLKKHSLHLCKSCSALWVPKGAIGKPRKPKVEKPLQAGKHFPFVTILLLAACAAATIVFAHVSQESSELFVFYPKQAFRLLGLPALLSIFTHADFTHLAGNGAALLVSGVLLESNLGWKKFLALFAFCALAGLLGQAYASPIGGVGASGAASGLLAALISTEPRARIGWIPLWALAFVWLGFDMLGMKEADGMSHGAHIGGALAGALLLCFSEFQVKAKRAVLS